MSAYFLNTLNNHLDDKASSRAQPIAVGRLPASSAWRVIFVNSASISALACAPG
jgi:4-hydroxybenzoate polyprenyltransferase